MPSVSQLYSANERPKMGKKRNKKKKQTKQTKQNKQNKKNNKKATVIVKRG